MNIAGSLFVPLNPKAVGFFRGASRSSPIGVEIDRGLAVRMTIAWTGQSVLEVLNELVKRVPGQGWLVITSNEAGWPEAFGFLHRHFTGDTQQLSQ